MKPPQAAQILGLKEFTKDRAIDATLVRHFFASAVRSAHPDHGGSGADIAQLKKARDVLLAEIAKQEALIECPKCGGAGTIIAKRRVKCPKCNGTGKIRRP